MSSEKSLTPQIRFKGFTEAWEQRKVFEIANRLDNLRVPVASNLRIPGNTPYYGANGIQDYVSGYTHDGEFVLVAEDGANDLKNYPVQYVSGQIWVNNHAHVLQGLERVIDNRFLSFSLVRCDIEVLLVGGGRSKLNANTLMNELTLSLPNLNEQKNIGELFFKLDDLITLHQRKLDALKKIKSALLEKMFPKDGSDIPEIRFAGFTEAWEQRKLGDIATKQTSKNINSTIQEPFTNSAEQGVVSQYDYFDHGITNVANISNYFVICPDDFVYNPRISVTAPCGPINRNRLNRPGIMSPLYTIFRADQCIAVTYLEYYFKTKKWHPFMFLEGNTGARSDRFSISDSTFFKMPIQIPSKAEQKLISEQLEALSNLITLHQRKLDALKKIKSALLEKMFV